MQHLNEMHWTAGPGLPGLSALVSQANCSSKLQQNCFTSLRMVVLILTCYPAVFWHSLFKCEKHFEVSGHATEVRTVISPLALHFSVACSISKCWKWHWAEKTISVLQEKKKRSLFCRRKKGRHFEGKRKHMGERKSACEKEGTDSSVGEKQFSSQIVQSLSQVMWMSSLVSLGPSMAETIDSSYVPNNAHRRSFEDAAMFPQRFPFQKEKRFGRKTPDQPYLQSHSHLFAQVIPSAWFT